ncbi:hypothetical protein C5167_003284 [Papaver somniferum]|uniref:Uncharacterized protein n=1 Tax=Papaver somniferum TaxID=3469 RepID=A0A4Y7L4G7_PAPSO|nr:hypothetical protein C5167_003284 [Papaver somniferum]
MNLNSARGFWPVTPLLTVKGYTFSDRCDRISVECSASSCSRFPWFHRICGISPRILICSDSQFFLDIGSVSRILDSIMKLRLQFCWTIESENSTLNSRLAGSQRAPFLRRFLLRLNFSSFFETTARGVLNVVRSRPTLPDLPQ